MELHYPTHLHDRHDDYQLSPESLVIDRSMYSSTQQAVFPESAPQRKLTPNLRDKVKYVVHYRNLKLYLHLGLVAIKVHRWLTFKQSPWLKTDIEFKLMNNIVFGKTQENLRNRVCYVELVTDARILRKRVAKPITDCLTVIQCKVATLTLNRPIYVGFSVLELSKLRMYVSHYNHMCVKYPRANQLRLLFTDTYSLAYAVQTDDIYRDIADDAASRYDFSEYPLDHPLHVTSDRKALGFFKDELNSMPVQEFVGLRPKCYAFLCTGKVDKNMLQHTRPVEKKTANGIKRKVKDVHLHFAHYLGVLRGFNRMSVSKI